MMLLIALFVFILYLYCARTFQISPGTIIQPVRNRLRSARYRFHPHYRRIFPR